MISQDVLQAADGQIVDIRRDNVSLFGRLRLRKDRALVELVWTLQPRTEEIALDKITAVRVIPDRGASPDRAGRISAHAAWELFEHVLRAALFEPKCQVRFSGRDDEAVIRNALGYEARLMFHCPWPDEYVSQATWEGDVTWADLSAMSREEAVRAVLYTDPHDLPTIKSSDQLYPPEG